MCKEDPVVFIERVCGVELLEYQKVVMRETFKKLNKSEVRSKCLCEPNSLYGTKTVHIFFDDTPINEAFGLKPSEPKADFEKIYTDALMALNGYNPNDDEGKEK